MLDDASVIARLYVSEAESVFLGGSKSGRGVKKNYKKIQNKTCTWKKERQKKVGLLLFLRVNIERYIHIINIYTYIYIILYTYNVYYTNCEMSIFFFFFTVYFSSRPRQVECFSLFVFFLLPILCAPSNCECFLESFVFCICCNSLQPGVPCLSYFSACDTHTCVSNELSRMTAQKAFSVGHGGGDGARHMIRNSGMPPVVYFCVERTRFWPRASLQTWSPNRNGENAARVSRTSFSWWCLLPGYWAWANCG